ncbi:HAD family phosphatase [Nonomuraea sp. MCN248]|uniref:HAD family phosphatase n=1 Tax=Nonomuraea corallina TaxID=2989783 RepID=A0ABT4S612_9ACTN|nr:HAD family phosphatase [Nonomuraea corallina]MDA0632590.1 HAD family phosphatase [Nonomuraea corallina]
MRWILFDYGNVLSLAQPAAEAEAMARAVGADPAAFLRGYWEHRLEFDRGSLTPAEYWAGAAGRPVSGADLDRLIAMDVASWSHPDEGSLAILRELLEQGRDVALLSNAPACVADGLDKLPWVAAIPRRYYSARLGLVKPDPRIYAHVAAELAADPADVLFVDDRADNVAGARDAGMRAVQYTDAAALRAFLESGGG